MNCFIQTKRLSPFVIGLLLASPGSLFAANELNLANSPLAISAAVDPNVMFLLDNSGSMNNVVWHQDYRSTTDYEHWNDGDGWVRTETYMTLSSLGVANTGCASPDPTPITIDDNGVSVTVPRYSIKASYDGEPKCLIVPDILAAIPTNDPGTTRYTGNYLNYLFQTYPDGTDLSKIIPYKTRFMAMKDVTNVLINKVQDMRFGVMAFNGSQGGILEASCGTDKPTLFDKINKLKADSSTPLAEAMYEVTRYFRGLRPYYRNGNFTSPIQYSCQKNFVIALTDGLPTNDTDFDTTDGDIDKYCPTTNCSLPNWDKLSPPTGTRFSDGNGGSGEGGRLYFDDIVKFAYDVDMKTGPGFDEPPFDKQNIETYAVGFSLDNQTLKDAGHYGSGRSSQDPETVPPANYFTAQNEGDLLNSLNDAITSIAGKSGTASSVAASAGFVGADGTSLYQASFQKSSETGQWTGNLKQLTIGVDPQTSSISITDSGINAATVLSSQLATSVSGKPTNRNIFSYSPVATTTPGINFQWNQLSAVQKAHLNNREEILNYIWGVQDCEIDFTAGTCPTGQTKNLRSRNTDNSGFLGTIVNSTPIFIANPIEYYPPYWTGTNSPENLTESEKYSAFKETYLNRQGTLYVGANDGMLHAFNADTLEELFAYVPNEILNKLPTYANSSFDHAYFVDGTPNIIDVFHGSNAGGNNTWRTILTGGLNKGGQGIYTLDVTNPTSFSRRGVLWEFTDDTDRDLGYTYSRPAVIRMHNGKWAAVFGNGYNNTEIDDGDSNGDGVIDTNDDTGANDSITGNAVLYIVDIHSGELIRKIDTGIGSAQDPTGNNRPNGLATLGPVDVNSDAVVDYIYAGDLFGNLWRIDVTANSASAWKILGKGNSNSDSPIFVAKDANGNTQPITVRPEATKTDAGALMIYFGTGQYLQLSDRTNTSQQTFYGLLDDPVADAGPGNSTQLTRSDMLQQTIDSVQNKSGEIVRTFSQGGQDKYTSWYIDLPESGERVVGPAIVRGISKKKVIFTSIIPTADVCAFGGTSWLIELDARDGSRTYKPVFDLNFDGKLDKLDNISSTEVINGWSQKGIHTSPTILSGKDTEYKILSGSTGQLRAVGEAQFDEKNGERQSWRQIK